MPILFPQHTDEFAPPRPTCGRALLFGAMLCSLLLASSSAQSLARPGWAGSGLAPETWYQRAVFYRIGTPADMPSRVQLPSLQAFGVDAILLTPADLPSAAAAAVPAPDSGDAPLSLDDLLFECSRLHIRVLIPLDLTRSNTDILALAKSWLYRGAAGFVVNAAPALQSSASTTTPDRDTSSVHAIHLSRTASEAPVVAALHSLVASFPGDRILIADGSNLTSSIQLQVATLGPDATAPQPPARALLSSATGQALTPVEAARLLATPYPALLESAALPPALLGRVFPPLGTPEEPKPVEPAPPQPPSNVYGAYKPFVPKDLSAERRAEAAQMKAQDEADRIAVDTFPVQPMYDSIGTTPEARAAFYHRLVQLHRAKTSRAGSTMTALSISPTGFGWSITHTGAGTIVVVCNPLATQQRIDVRGRQIFRTLIHTAAASGIVHANGVSVGPQGVYIGQAVTGYE